jgi:sulfide:quinone oxidoreductase
MKTMKQVLILGAGFGGLELATSLQETLSDDVEVTLIDKSDYFIFGFAKFEVLFGRKRTQEIKSYYRNLPARVHFRQEQIQSIDPDRRRVVTNVTTYDADILVVALGADMDSGSTPGFAEGGYEFYTLGGVERLSPILPNFKSGVALITILGLPYKCPPAPFEAALQLHDYFAERNVRSEISIRVVSPAPTPLPVSREGSETILRLFGERGIEFVPGHQITSIDPATRQAHVKERGTISYDLFMGVPVHRVPSVVEASGLTREGWIPVNPANLETRFPNVFAIGDVTKIPAGSAVLPKAGAFADRAACSVTEEIAYRIRGKGSPARFDGAGTCYLEFGGGMVAKIEANFLGGPSPDVRFIGPSKEFRADKQAFASRRLERWFRKE